ncbi:MAG TPA: hypothetical protein VHZ26_10405 [Caulobacteraceae bacterium]|nr:hypothetical protein [Caulobacteraceae bacterium]
MRPFLLRTFELGGEQIPCSFERPVADGNDYRCDYQIVFPKRQQRGHAYGVDELQALLLAMQRAHVDLLSAPERRECMLLWLDHEDLGLPLPNNLEASDFPSGE